MDPHLQTLLIVLAGIAVVIGLILWLRVSAFIALITAAMLVALLAVDDRSKAIGNVAEAFGKVCGAIGIVIALAAVIGKCLMDSGAADRIVRSFLKLLGEKRGGLALAGSGFVLSIPVFFDTVFYLLVPLARSMYRRTGRHYLLYLLAIVAGAAVTHTLVPPTPGPLFIASELKIDLGMMMLMGVLVGLPAALIGLVACGVIDRLQPTAMRPYAGEEQIKPIPDDQLPPLGLSLLPVVLPVLLISANTVAKAMIGDAEQGRLVAVGYYTAILGNPNLALLLSAVIALAILAVWRKRSLKQIAQDVETALMSGGVIILITAAGGAFGAMLREAGIKEAVEGRFGTAVESGTVLLLLGFGVASMIKIAQGSGTVAMITTVGIISGMVPTAESLGFHPVYLGLAIGSGSLVGDWMNNSGFWIFAKMGVLTETETLKSWTPLTAIVGISAFLITFALAMVLPLA